MTSPAAPGGDLARALKHHFGFTSFRPNQREIIEAILDGRDVFAALPTGGGKSLCYQLPAVMGKDADGDRAREDAARSDAPAPGAAPAGGAVTLVVSPLIALMKDQVDGAREDGIPAAFLNSSLSEEESRAAWRELAGGRTRLLYASPERLALPGFRSALSRIGLRLIAVDEAHCISEWGHEFRPDYRSLGLLREEFPGVPIAAFTATATPQVQEDVIRLLGLRAPFVVRASFDRPEIFYRVLPKAGDGDEQVFDFIRGHPDQSGIVYRGTRKSVERTAELLHDRGISAAAYHAGLEDAVRRERQEAFVKDETTVIVATIAFGMGIDKSNVRWVVHADLPRSVEGYYQETGRAARDGEDADALLLYGPSDIAAIRWHIDKLESDVERERAEARLAGILRYVERVECRRTQLLAHFAERHPGSCGRCDVCAGEVRTEDLTEAARMVLSAAVRTGECFGGHHLADILVGNPTEKVMQKGHNNLPTFGVGRDRDRDWWLGLIRELDAGGLLVRGEERASGFRLSDKGRLLLRGKAGFSGARRVDGRGVAGGRGTARSGARSDAVSDLEQQSVDGPAQEELFHWLRQVRKRVAQARGLPPYVIFSDKTLRVMSRNRPTDPAALLRCHGVGDAKLAAYGDTFLKAIRDFLAAGWSGAGGD